MIRRILGHIVGRTMRLGLFACALALGGLLAYGVVSEPVNGSGVPETEVRAIGDITELDVSGHETVELVRGARPSVAITADDNLLPLLETRTSNGRLRIQSPPGQVHAVTPIRYVVTVPRLKRLAISGAARVTAAGLAGDQLAIESSGAGKADLHKLDCQSLSFKLSGAGNIVLDGRADKVSIHLSGAGDIDAKGLKAGTVETRISGAGNVSVWAADELKSRISGAGKIAYKGSPHIDQRVSGAGRVIAIE